jgi:hypothetical protein
MGTTQRDRAIQDFIKLPGVSKGVANDIYDMGMHSLKDLSKAEANYLFRLGLNRQLASNIERVMDIWEMEGGKIPIEDAVAMSKGRKARGGKRRGGGDEDGGKAKDSSGKESSDGAGRAIGSRDVLTGDGVIRKMRVCTVCKNLVTIRDGQCPYCRDHSTILPAKMLITEEDEGKARKTRLRRKLRDVKRLLENAERDELDLDKAWKTFKGAPEAFEDGEMDKCEKLMKKTIALVEVERMNRRQELEKKKRRLSGEIDEGGDIRWDLRHKGRLSLWYKWRRGFAVFVTPPSFHDKKFGKSRTLAKMQHYIKVLFWFGMITLAIVLMIMLLITVLVYFGFLEFPFYKP